MHISVQRRDVGCHQERGFWNFLAPNFGDKIVGVLYIRRMSYTDWPYEAIYVLTDPIRFASTVRNDGASLRHIWLGPFMPGFVNFWKQVECTRSICICSPQKVQLFHANKFLRLHRLQNIVNFRNVIFINGLTYFGIKFSIRKLPVSLSQICVFV